MRSTSPRLALINFILDRIELPSRFPAPWLRFSPMASTAAIFDKQELANEASVLQVAELLDNAITHYFEVGCVPTLQNKVPIRAGLIGAN